MAVTQHIKHFPSKAVQLDSRQQTVILIAITKYHTELCDERLEALPDSRREKEIDLNRLAVQQIREKLIG